MPHTIKKLEWKKYEAQNCIQNLVKKRKKIKQEIKTKVKVKMIKKIVCLVKGMLGKMT